LRYQTNTNPKIMNKTQAIENVSNSVASLEKINDFTLKFGKYKGQSFSSTPPTYQKWLLQQQWFKLPTSEPKPPKISKSWNGFSRKGESQEWAYFEYEKRMAERGDCTNGICSCCPESKYFGI
jgi:hypothetical protein